MRDAQSSTLLNFPRLIIVIDVNGSRPTIGRSPLWGGTDFLRENQILNSMAILMSRSIAAERVSPFFNVASKSVIKSEGRLTLTGVRRFSSGMVFLPIIRLLYLTGHKGWGSFFVIATTL